MSIIDNLPIITTPQSGDELPIERGTVAYKIDYDKLAAAIIAKVTPAGIGAVPKTGGYFTGAIGQDTGDDYSTAPSANEYNSGFGFRDSDDIWRGGLYSLRRTDGSYATLIAVRFPTESGNIFTRFGLLTDSSGNVSYLVDSPAALRSAISAATLSDVVVAYGTKEFGSVEAGTLQSDTISIGKTLANTNYIVLAQPISPLFGVGTQSKTRTSFNLLIRNNASATGTGTVMWAVIKLPD